MPNNNLQVPAVPLAERIRPKSLDEFRGQSHLLGAGKPIRLMIERDSLSSFILWGPPGTGKTTIAKLVALRTKSVFRQINAVSSGVKDIREVIAESNKLKEEAIANPPILPLRTILFIDEIHRFNKAQQDALLGAVEAGIITLIGATTENPSFEIIPALRSRMRIFKLEYLQLKELEEILFYSLEHDIFLKQFSISSIDTNFLCTVAGGDARVLLNILEAAVLQESFSDSINLTSSVIENVIQKKHVLYDKGGEEHYNVISAFIKSIRGSDPDAALYWLARMVRGGEDPLFIARRLLILASEDIGNASPNGLVLAEAAFSAIEKIGLPEGIIILAQCTTYLACSPKSNASYMGIMNAMQEAEKEAEHSVPLHLRNAPTQIMKSFGYSKGYKYPHEFLNHFLNENYFPKEMTPKQYYFPTDLGQEKVLLERLKFLWKDTKKYD